MGLTALLASSSREGETASADVYNLMNASYVLTLATRYGPAWLNAIQITGGRLMKVSVQLDF